MQLGAVLVCDAGPLLLRHGGIDVERLRTYTGMRIAAVSRARERRAELAFGALEAFVPDARFELEYHVRHASLPRPGDDRALKRLAARIFSEPLDPARPPWQLWVVEGVDAGRFALVAVCDAALVGPGSTGDLVQALLAREPGPAVATPGWLARAGAALQRRAVAALSPVRLAGRAMAGALDLAESALGGGDAFGPGSGGALRRVDWLELDAADVDAVRTRLGGSERDVALAALSGGLRHLFERRGAEARVLRALTPICVGGRSAAPRVRLPTAIADARARLVVLRGASERAGTPDTGAEPPLRALASLAAAAADGRRAELVAAALPALAGEPEVAGAPVRAVVPVLPPLPAQALGVTVTRLGARVFVGLAADASRVPELSALADGTASAFDELRRIVAEARVRPAARRVAKPRRRRATRSSEAEAQ
ncbi:MAG TPA: wax ester/triacylglycerol synthase domain-containing protein [Myxococcota bacterium]|nr:wax ester/triacylglycerol synthase domain-containing protein [Myxococcota bacterium]